MLRRTIDRPLLSFIRWMGIHAGPMPEMSLIQLRSFELTLQSMQLTVAYLAILLLYPIMKLYDDMGVEHVLGALFPLGFESVQFMLVLFANDALQDIITLVTVVMHSGAFMTRYFSTWRSKHFWTLFCMANFLTTLSASQMCAALWAAKKMGAVCPWMDDC
eukprot:467875-Prymnesium_polylepis.1